MADLSSCTKPPLHLELLPKARKGRSRGRHLPVLALLFVTAATAHAENPTLEILAAMNADRGRLDRPPLSQSPVLTKLAQQRASEMTAAGALDFEVISGLELLARARDLGWKGLLAQELTSADDRSPCEIVEFWNDSLGPSDVYRRPEVAELGVGFGMVGDTPLTVVIVGVPVSLDSEKKHWPGIAPREYAIADLFRDVNRKRMGLGLPPLERSDELDVLAQQTADELLGDPKSRSEGAKALPEGTALYLKGNSAQAATDRSAIDRWFFLYRAILTTSRQIMAGGGLASRGRDGRLEAVWVLVVSEGRVNGGV